MIARLRNGLICFSLEIGKAAIPLLQCLRELKNVGGYFYGKEYSELV